MRLLRAFGRWLVDWRNGATLIGTVLVALLIWTVVDGEMDQRRAFDTADEAFHQLELSRAAATRRIDKLSARIADLEASNHDSRAEIAALRAEQAVLIEQLRREGVEPVVVNVTPSASTTTTTRPPPSTTTTTAPPPDDPDEDDDGDDSGGGGGICLPIICS